MKLNIIVVSWNTCDLLRGCLRSVYSDMELPESEYDLWVVDNASCDGSASMVREEFPRVRLIANDSNAGFGRANNQVFAATKAPYVLLLNPDTIVLDHAIDRMLARMESDPAIGALGCRLVDADGSLQRYTGGHSPNLKNLASHFLMLHKVLPARFLPRPLYLESDPQNDLFVGWISGACLMVRRSALDGALFDDRFFMYGEDIELCSRVRRRGFHIAYAPSIRIVHFDGQSVSVHPERLQPSKLRGMRLAYRLAEGTRFLLAYDLIVTVGFVLRTMFNHVASLWFPRRDFREKAAVSGVLLAEAWRALLHERRNQ